MCPFPSLIPMGMDVDSQRNSSGVLPLIVSMSTPIFSMSTIPNFCMSSNVYLSQSVSTISQAQAEVHMSQHEYKYILISSMVLILVLLTTMSWVQLSALYTCTPDIVLILKGCCAFATGCKHNYIELNFKEIKFYFHPPHIFAVDYIILQYYLQYNAQDQLSELMTYGFQIPLYPSEKKKAY